jgi:uncharacterized protein YrrD
MKVIGVGEFQSLISGRKVKTNEDYVIINKKKLVVVAFFKALALPKDVKVVTTVETKLITD